eukprot:EC792280.1.p1 GENE.EC792280.1~~EC792280.1.p1  ORF type:complete len:123 (+),score=4.70 EC792280.1:131-499(+)
MPPYRARSAMARPLADPLFFVFSPSFIFLLHLSLLVVCLCVAVAIRFGVCDALTQGCVVLVPSLQFCWTASTSPPVADGAHRPPGPSGGRSAHGAVRTCLPTPSSVQHTIMCCMMHVVIVNA